MKAKVVTESLILCLFFLDSLHSQQQSADMSQVGVSLFNQFSVLPPFQIFLLN